MPVQKTLESEINLRHAPSTTLGFSRGWAENSSLTPKENQQLLAITEGRKLKGAMKERVWQWLFIPKGLSSLKTFRVFRDLSGRSEGLFGRGFFEMALGTYPLGFWGSLGKALIHAT